MELPPLPTQRWPKVVPRQPYEGSRCKSFMLILERTEKEWADQLRRVIAMHLVSGLLTRVVAWWGFDYLGEAWVTEDSNLEALESGHKRYFVLLQFHSPLVLRDARLKLASMLQALVQDPIPAHLAREFSARLTLFTYDLYVLAHSNWGKIDEADDGPHSVAEMLLPVINDEHPDQDVEPEDVDDPIVPYAKQTSVPAYIKLMGLPLSFSNHFNVPDGPGEVDCYIAKHMSAPKVVSVIRAYRGTGTKLTTREQAARLMVDLRAMERKCLLPPCSAQNRVLRATHFVTQENEALPSKEFVRALRAAASEPGPSGSDGGPTPDPTPLQRLVKHFSPADLCLAEQVRHHMQEELPALLELAMAANRQSYSHRVWPSWKP